GTRDADRGNSCRAPLRGGALVDGISHPSFVALHVPSTSGNAAIPARLARLHEQFPDYVVGEPASRAQLELVHDSAYVDAIQAIEGDDWLDPDTYASAARGGAAGVR